MGHFVSRIIIAQSNFLCIKKFLPRLEKVQDVEPMLKKFENTYWIDVALPTLKKHHDIMFSSNPN